MSNGPRPQSSLVRNAADPRQVRFAEEFERRRAERFDSALAEVMNTVAGRTVFAALIRRAGVLRSIWHPSSEIHFNAGQQSFGLEMMADIVRVTEDLYQLMEREEWAWAKKEQATIEAAHTRRSTARTEETS